MVWYWDPFEDIRRMREDMESLFGSDRLLPERAGREAVVPAGERLRHAVARLEESDEGFVVTAELPGAKKEEIDIQVNPDSIVIRTEHKEVKEEKGKEGWSSSSVRSSFYRAIGFPSPVDTKKAKAAYEEGVLIVKVPRLGEAKGRKLLVE